MRKFSLAGEKSFDNGDKQHIQLAYYLVEDYRDAVVGTPLYGIQIVKKVKDKGFVHQEKETAAAISYSEELVRGLLQEMIDGTVTPMCLLEMVDELVTVDMHCSA